MSGYTLTGAEAIPALEAFRTDDEAAAVQDLIDVFGARVAIASCARTAMHIARQLSQVLGVTASQIIATAGEDITVPANDLANHRFIREVWFWERTFEISRSQKMDFRVHGRNDEEQHDSLVAALDFTDHLLGVAAANGIARADALDRCRTSVLRMLS